MEHSHSISSLQLAAGLVINKFKELLRLMLTIVNFTIVLPHHPQSKIVFKLLCFTLMEANIFPISFG